jgi:hypothetical protein
MKTTLGTNKSKKADMNFMVVTMIIALIILLVFLIFPAKIGQGGSMFSEFACKYINIKKACNTDTDSSKVIDSGVFNEFNKALRDSAKFTGYSLTPAEIMAVISGNCLQQLSGVDGKSVFLFKSQAQGKPIYLLVGSDFYSVGVLTYTLPADDKNIYLMSDIVKKVGGNYGISQALRCNPPNCNNIKFDFDGAFADKAKNCPS